MSGDGGGASNTGRRAALYVLSEKGAHAALAGVEPVPVEYPDARHTKHAFKKLLRAAAPSAPQSPDEPGFYRYVTRRRGRVLWPNGPRGYGAWIAGGSPFGTYSWRVPGAPS